MTGIVDVRQSRKCSIPAWIPIAQIFVSSETSIYELVTPKALCCS
jgi:hypothetical protein